MHTLKTRRATALFRRGTGPRTGPLFRMAAGVYSMAYTMPDVIRSFQNERGETMENSGRILATLLGLAVITTLVGAGLTGCSPLDDSQKFDPDTANASTIVGPSSM